MTEKQTIAINVKRLREAKQLTVIQAAEQLGVGRQYWYLIEKGEANPTLEKLLHMARILGVTITDLFTEPKKKKEPHNQMSDKTIPVTLDLSPQLFQTLEVLQESTEAESKTAVMRNALRLYELFVTTTQSGAHW